MVARKSNPEIDDHLISEIARLNRLAIYWLGAIILVAVLGLISLAVVDAGFWGTASTNGEGIAVRGNQTDQAVAILGNIASAGIGGLVAWFTRDVLVRLRGGQEFKGTTHEDG